MPHRRIAEVDERLWTKLRTILERPDLLHGAVAQREADADAGRTAWRQDLVAANERLARLQQAEAAILARFRRGLVSEPAMDAELAAAARERSMLERQVDAARRGAAAEEASGARHPDTRTQVDALLRKLRSRSLPRRRELVVAMLGQSPVIMSPEEVRAMIRLRLAPARAVGSLDSLVEEGEKRLPWAMSRRTREASVAG